MRARLVRPEFWEDSLMATLPDSVRLFYIGTWCIADDAGYFEWDLPKVAHALMFTPTPARIRKAERLLQALVDAGRIRRLDCGRHGLIPSLERHRITGGNKNYRVEIAHKRCVQRAFRDAQEQSTYQSVLSTDKSRSESLSESLSESHSSRGRAQRALAPNEEDDRAKAIARAKAKLDDPGASDDVRQAARFALERLGAPAA